MVNVKVAIDNGPSVEVEWTQGMNAQKAMERAWKAMGRKLTYSLQYFGRFGYMVAMINETYDTFMSTYAPFYYWEFRVNGVPAKKGIDHVILEDGDEVSFSYGLYEPDGASPQLAAKHESYQEALQAA